MQVDLSKLVPAVITAITLSTGATLWSMYNDIQLIKYTKADKEEVDKKFKEQDIALTRSITLQESIIEILDSIRKDNEKIKEDVTDIKVKLGK